MEADIALEDRRKAWVGENTDNSRKLAEAEAFRVGAVMAALEKADPRVVQALAAVGMQPGQLIASDAVGPEPEGGVGRDRSAVLRLRSGQ